VGRRNRGPSRPGLPPCYVLIVAAVHFELHLSSTLHGVNRRNVPPLLDVAGDASGALATLIITDAVS
jgi:hypothetical protein